MNSFRYPLGAVLPSADVAANYIHLDDKEHPGYKFMTEKLRELRDSRLYAVGCFVILPVESLDIKNGNMRIGGTELHLARKVCGYMHGAVKAALFLCTAGEVFSVQYREYSKRGDYLEAYITDALGSLTVENAIGMIQDELAGEMRKEGLQISNRYSPGYCNWPLVEQKALFALVGENPTGITLSASSLMFPTKSVSGIIGIGPKIRRLDYDCMTCNNKTCIYRRIVQKKK